MIQPRKSLPAVLVVDRDKTVRDGIKRTLGHAGYPTVTVDNALSAVEILENQAVGLLICEREFHSGANSIMTAQRACAHQAPVLVLSERPSVDTVVEAVKNGAADFLAKPVNSDTLLKLVAEYLPAHTEGDKLVVEDALSQRIKHLALRVSTTDATVLICGPSGVGKEVFSRYIHSQSRRAEKPFVAVNCAAIPENMLEAMLFGYEKGAYTGAVNNHIGKFEQAQGGTLLLDEISEMALGLQAKLLRVLQERELERLGGRRLIQLDVRVLATTNRDLRSAVRRGEFREDLFYRLNVFPIQVPALKDRPADILPLSQFFLAQHDANVTLSAAAQQKLVGHSWPGNVRELDNVIQRALILQSSREITEQDIQFELCDTAHTDCPETTVQVTDTSLNTWMREQEHLQIQNAIRQGGSKKEAAAILGISPRTLRYKIARLREAEMGA